MAKSPFSRRELLKLGALSSASLAYMIKSPEQLLGEAIIKNLFSTAYAEAGGHQSARFYVNLNLPGGPTRYNFDHWLRNSDEAAVLQSPSMGTSFTYNAAGVATGTEYRTFSYNGYEIPQTFMSLDATSRAQFLESFLVIRGYGTGIDGHPINAPLQLHPVAGLQSLTGLLADNAATPYQAVQYPPRSYARYVSKKSVGLNILNGTTPLKSLLGPVVTSNSARTLRSANQDVFSQLRSILNSITEATPQETKAISIAKNSIDSAYSLMQRNFSSFATDYAALVTDYETAIKAGIRNASIPGLTTTIDGSQALKIISDGAADGLYQMWTPPATKIVPPSGHDLTKLVDQATVRNLASGLALADYCIQNNLSSALEISADDFMNVRASEGGTFVTHLNDSHGSGAYANVFLTGVMYAGILSGLMRFKDRMSVAGKWNNTVVHITSEFNRTVDASGIGSGHGFDQMVASVFSGVIQGGPYMVGNVYRNTKGLSQGFAAPLQGYTHSSMPSPITMASTVAELMDIDVNPWKNNSPSLVQLSGNQLILPFSKGKQVA